MRITIKQREAAIKAYVLAKTEKKLEKLELAYKKEGDKLYKKHVPKEIAEFAELHPNFFGGKSDSLGVEYTSYYMTTGRWVPNRGINFKGFDASTYRAVRKEYDEAVSRRNELIYQLEASLSDCNTDKKLLTAMPELKAYLPTPKQEAVALSKRPKELIAELDKFPDPANSAANKKGAGRALRAAKRNQEKGE